ncbi:hypothetical protein ABLE68_21140 [Nocardioides sp. CN2-186]|uniref:hypothetical protein n=1 Tax=Nocardioides tweenelious TaxID=3156607 RepID=UPI0032B620ED
MTAGSRRRPAGADRVLLGGVALIVLAAAIRTWTATQTWFYVDDFPLVATAARDGLSLHDLFQPYIGHLMPAGRAAAWLTTAGGGYDYPVAVAELIALYVLVGAGALRLFRTLFGSRPVVLLLLAYLLLSPWLISPTAWWAAGINHLPALAATAWALDAVIRHLRDPQRRHLVASVLWIVFGLAFAELALLAYVPVLVVALGYFARGSLPQRVGHLWTSYRSLVVVHAVLGAAYLAAYVATSWDPTGDRPPAPWRDYLVNLIGTVLPSAFIGGPGTWKQEWAAQFDVAPAVWMRLLGLAVVVGLVALSAMTRERALRAWLIPLSQVAATVVLMSQTRSIFGGSFILDLRFTTPLALGTALALGLAFLPVEGALESSAPRSTHWLVDRPAPAVLALAVFAGLAVWSATTFPLLHVPQDQSAKRFFATFERSLDQHDAPVEMVDAPMPGFVFSGVEGRYATSLSMYDEVEVPAVVQDDYYVLDDTGALVRPALDVARRAPAVTGGTGCDGHLVGSTGAGIALDGPVFGATWRLRVTYSATAETPAVITLGDREVPVTLLAGEHTLETSGAGQYDAVRIDGLDDGVSACVSSLEVGTTRVP